MGPWFACDEDAAACRKTPRDPRPGTTDGSPVTISRSVGVGGTNVRADVLEIQKALNRIPVPQGGPAPPLDEDGWYGQLTGGAIRRFQTVQFPGWSPDGKIDPGQKTLQRLNALLAEANPLVLYQQAEPSGVEYAYQSVPKAIALASIAISRLEAVKIAYLNPSAFFQSRAERRAVEWHFKTHKTTNPVAQIDRVLDIYRLMITVLDGANLSRLFQVGREEFYETAVAYTRVGGYYLTPAKPGKTIGPMLDPGYYIYIPPGRRAGARPIVHELAHYCGGPWGTSLAIRHKALPFPHPKGRPYDDGVRNYFDMTPDDAYTNAFSYQYYTATDEWYGKVPDTF